MSVYVHVSAGSCGGQKRASFLWSWSCRWSLTTIWVLGPELQASARAANTFTAASPAPNGDFLRLHIVSEVRWAFWCLAYFTFHMSSTSLH